MGEIIWTKSALKDLKSIHRYISIDSFFYADRFVLKIIDRVNQLSNQPKSGRAVPEIEDPTIRELIEGNYRIFYKTPKAGVIILRIHHSSKNIK
jgi:toxin ParE1/3/4